MPIFHTDRPLPWGRNATEYKSIFNLFDLDQGCKLIDVAGGPSSVNAELTEEGYDMVSADPLYAFTQDEIFDAIQQGRQTIMNGISQNHHMCKWDLYKSPEDLEQSRMHAMQYFLDDYEAGLAEGRYVTSALPELPFPAGQFDMALCSHFLFTYSDILDTAFHEAAALELMRISKQTRIYPLIDLHGEVSRHLAAVTATLTTEGYEVTQEKAGLEFMKGASHMLVIRNPDDRT